MIHLGLANGAVLQEALTAWGNVYPEPAAPVLRPASWLQR